MSEPMESNRRVAYHEAGHAVMAWALGRGIDRISITVGPDGHGRTEVDPFETPWGIEDPGDLQRWVEWRDALYVLAGSVAEVIAFGQANDAAERFDLGLLASHENRLTASNRERARSEVRSVLSEHWPVVETLAARLAAPPVMIDGSEVRTIIRSAATNEQIKSRLERCPWLFEWRLSRVIPVVTWFDEGEFVADLNPQERRCIELACGFLQGRFGGDWTIPDGPTLAGPATWRPDATHA